MSIKTFKTPFRIILAILLGLWLGTLAALVSQIVSR